MSPCVILASIDRGTETRLLDVGHASFGFTTICLTSTLCLLSKYLCVPYPCSWLSSPLSVAIRLASAQVQSDLPSRAHRNPLLLWTRIRLRREQYTARSCWSAFTVIYHSPALTPGQQLVSLQSPVRTREKERET